VVRHPRPRPDLAQDRRSGGRDRSGGRRLGRDPDRGAFQFRNDGSQPLDIIAATMPPWPGDREAYLVDGKWEPTV
jgi:hypothetical protein